MVILVTGKPGSGKTTYASRLRDELEVDGIKVEWLDSEAVRMETNNQDFSYNGRKRHLLDLACRASVLEDKGYVVVVSAVSPRENWRRNMRAKWKESILVYIPGGKLWEGTTYERPGFSEFLNNYIPPRVNRQWHPQV